MTWSDLNTPEDVMNPELASAVRRFKNEKTGEVNVRVFQGQYYVSGNANEVITTVLGSCIAVCIRDPKTGYGGMNHFVLPSAAKSLPQGFSMRYGIYSIERLVNEILSIGGERDRLEVKVFGGANVLAGSKQIGSRNSDFVEDYLAREGLAIASKHVRGILARRVRYYPTSGRVLMSTINSKTSEIGRTEANLMERNLLEAGAGKVEIFGASD